MPEGVAWGTVSYEIGEEEAFTGVAGVTEHGVEEATGAADEGLLSVVFLLAPGFAYEHDGCAR